jgi:hypothetical protein
MPDPKCACGLAFANAKELRVHIALETERWPVHRCCPEHHDPHNPGDVRALRWLALTKEST